MSDKTIDEEAAKTIWAGSHNGNVAVTSIAAAIAQARAEGKAAERERIAKWFEAKWIDESGPDWGLSSDEERRDTRYHNRRVMAYAAAIREAKP